MDSQKIIDAVNHGLGIMNGGLFTTIHSLENSHLTVLRGELDGRAVRIEVSVDDAPGPYQFSIWLFDEETGDTLGRGNGGATLNDAASIYQWNNVLSDLRALES